MASYSKRSDIEKQFEKKLEEAGISPYRYSFSGIKREVSELLDDGEEIGTILLVGGKQMSSLDDPEWLSSLRMRAGLPSRLLGFDAARNFSPRREMLWIITDTRLVIADSYYDRIGTHMLYSHIRSVDYSDKLFSGNSGTLTIECAGRHALLEQLVFEGLNKDLGRKLAAFLKSAAEIGINIGKILKQIVAENVSASEVIAMLEKLGSLKNQGLITDEEFQRAKSKLINRSH